MLVQAAELEAAERQMALLVALVLAYYLLAVRRGWSQALTADVMEEALPPAAVVILVTGAGGAFAKVLTESGVGIVLSETPGLDRAADPGARLRAVTAAPRVAGVGDRGDPHHGGPSRESVAGGDYTTVQVALISLAVAFGALGLSHVNDSGSGSSRATSG